MNIIINQRNQTRILIEAIFAIKSTKIKEF